MPLYRYLRPLLAGVPIGILVAVAMSELPMRWNLVLFAGLVTLLPIVVLKDKRLYGVGLYLFALLLEADAGKNIAQQLIDGNELMQRLGIPPARSIGIMIRPSDIVLLFLMVSWLLRILTKKEKIRWSGFASLALVYLCWSAATAFVTAPYK